MPSHPKVLASDLDGTLLPLADNIVNRADLKTLADELQARGIKLAFATGRHFNSVQSVITEEELPVPNWIICDVGTSIYYRRDAAAFEISQDFVQHLADITAGLTTAELHQLLEGIADLERQEDAKQTRFKLSYYAHRDSLPDCVAQIQSIILQRSIPYGVIASVDPFTGDGLVDLLPRGSSKAYALKWWAQAVGMEQEHVLYAGDSGNDSAAFAAGFRSIIVNNAASDVLDEAQRAHAAAGWSGRIFAASTPATSGVLEGLRHFLAH